MKKALSFILSLSLLCMTPSFTSLAEEADIASEEVIIVEAQDAETVEAEEIEDVTVVEEAIIIDDAAAKAIESVATVEEKVAGTLVVTAVASKTSAPVNSKVSISATVSGAPSEDITYHWQKSLDGTTWGGTSLTGSRSDTLSFTVTEARLSYYYRVVVWSGDYRAYSNAVKIEATQSPTVSISANKNAVPLNARVVITGNVANTVGEVTYKWQKSTDGQNWGATTLTGANSAELSFTATEARLSYFYRLVVTDENRHWYSNAVKVELAENPTVSAYANVNEAAYGDRVIITAAVNGTDGDVTYQWQKSADGQTGWTKTKLDGYDTMELSFAATEARLESYYRLKVKDSNGNWYSNPVKVNYYTTAVEPVLGEISVSVEGHDTWVGPTESDINFFDYLNDGNLFVNASANGASKIVVTVDLMNVVPQFDTDQGDDVVVSYQNENGGVGIADYELAQYGCEYAKVIVTAYDENYEQTGVTDAFQFGIRFTKHVAVLLCNSDYDRDGDPNDEGDLPGVANDCTVMANLLNNLGWEVHVNQNLTAEEMKAAIADGFANTTAEDVCMVYYSGHGLGDYDWVDYLGNPNVGFDMESGFVHIGDALGALCGTGDGDDFLFLPDFATALDNACAGKVIVLMDSCFSGAALDIASTDETFFIDTNLLVAAPAAQLRSFNDSVVKSFKNLNAKVTTRSPKTGSLLVEDKFYVMTAAAQDQTSWDATINGIRCGYFTCHMLMGLGVSYPDAAFAADMPGDVDGDYRYSLSEAYHFTKDIIDEAYSEDVDSFVSGNYNTIVGMYNSYASDEEEGEEFLAAYPTLEDYIAALIDYYIGDCQVTCAFGDGNYVLFSRVGQITNGYLSVR